MQVWHRLGDGSIVLCSHGDTVSFSELSSTYPLKLLSPKATQNGVALVYAMTYGGGLVGGDRISLSINVGVDCILTVLSQGSTKVFKTRPSNRRALSKAIPSGDPSITTQNMTTILHPRSTLLLLPDPVTCFRDASYAQTQIFHLARDASLVLLDWITSGRKSSGEEWVFSRYYSMNEVWIDGKRMAKDALLLEESSEPNPLGLRTLRQRLAPYSCYANVILYGPLVQTTVQDLSHSYGGLSVFKHNSPTDLIWSLSPIEGGVGHMLRVAGKETEYVKTWLGDALRRLEDVVGVDVYRKAFS